MRNRSFRATRQVRRRNVQSPVKDRIAKILREADDALTLDDIWFALGDQSKDCIRVHLSQMAIKGLVDKVPPPKLETKWIIALADNED